ncbi:hypothetical protein BRADI_2g08823v3 [Brachypodium distachyon]|uniref:Uncharacterized protein n=1 Tax=Brachypodium distachyon TaxID=15368 RepID=A0A0Q3JYN3_BRADI|nr:hypothetical protein BRADI_2g08823v3 [Brachypodium distachyon]
MQLTLFNCCPPPCPCADGGGCYEELPVSVPPHVPLGLSREYDQWEEGAYAGAVEQLQLPDGHRGVSAEITETGSGFGAWLLAAFASVYRNMVVPVHRAFWTDSRCLKHRPEA